ncbi:elongator complex protein 5 isoform X1 [Gossypium australe]|uniref:Elongator complex protein 5 n=1 Tax=Gossypium australe TaxID=47621 RepID=A0A5B6UX06_9ROSI|nr:elongator complex protein 5 isoform X1 [Gossypium australe]
MAESICRALRDGALEGELAPALTIKDSSPCRRFIFPEIQVLDCYSDPLGWKDQLAGSRNFTALSNEVDEMLRHAPVSSVARLLSNLRSHDQISNIFWLLHSDLHEARVTAVLEYLSSIVASLEPSHQLANGQRGDLENFSLIKHNSKKGKFHVRFKKRNGRSSINFTSLPSEGAINQGLVPKVQFSLQLSEKERIDKANVVLPFEHQGNGKPIQIYDGRRSLVDSKHERPVAAVENVQTNENCGSGEIIYYRDSDDEMPDSDEDPDDDLDI